MLITIACDYADNLGPSCIYTDEKKKIAYFFHPVLIFFSSP